uniref:Arrestin C-terminal-like domain-containing protein n=1 Tax=Gadus morhua TaxID=8049 RepID=A0A8C4ZW68_GADMO
MEDTVKDFSVSYNRINNEDTFTGGDFISGNIKLELSKDCKINSLYVQIKGKAKVLWSEDHGRTSTVYSSTEKFLSIKQSVIQELKGQGKCAVYNMNLIHMCIMYIQYLPSSFKSFTGKIQYRVKAYLSRSMSRDTKANAPFTVISKIPQHSTKDQKLRLFNSGKVTMDVHINKMAFCQGKGPSDNLCLITNDDLMNNSSSRDIKPKYCLYLKTSFFANGKKKVKTKDLVKEVGEPIPHSAGQNVIRVITAPATAEVSILNCSIIKHEYRLKVYLDVKYQFDPEVDFPIVILPATASPGLGQPPAYGGYGFEAFGNPSPTSAAYEPSAPPPPPSYGTYSLYPPLS